jgi:hypothetical protein
MKRIVILILSIAILVGFGGVVLRGTAQTVADISLATIPLNPQPGTQVTITATSYGFDLDQSYITWTYNGTTVASGTGMRTINVVVPAAGATGLISMTASGGGTSGSATILLRPASVDMLWEAVDAITPPFYKGKALLADGGTVRVTVVPSASAPTNLSYTWSRNSTTIPEVSGFGKSSITFKQDILTGTEQVAVDARGGIFSGTGSVVLAPRNADVVAYQNNDGFIDYAHGYASTIPVQGTGALLHFEPYYMSVPESIGRDLAISMTSGGTAVDQSTNQTELGIARLDEGGQSELTVAIDTVAYSLQHIQKVFTVLFN